MKRLICVEAPDLVGEWPSKNSSLTPDKVTVGSHKKVWWSGKCGHEWQAVVKNRVNGAGCPYCSGNAVLAGVTDLRTIRPDIAEEWSFRNARNPEDFTVRSNHEAWWKCRLCGNEWIARIADRTSGSGCPYCGGKILAGFNDIAVLRPDLMREWFPRNRAGLEHEISDKADRMVWWHCRECGTDWRANVRTRARGGGKCPGCAKRETIRAGSFRKLSRKRERWVSKCLPRATVLFYLSQLTEKILQNDASLMGLPLDLYAPALGVAFELEEPMGLKTSRRVDAIVKSSLCRRNRVILIKLQSDEMETYEDCICVSYSREDRNSLELALKEIFNLLGFPADIDIRRDLNAIMEHYEER